MFKYLGNELSYQGEVDVGSKIAKFLRVTGLINRTLSTNKVLKKNMIEGVQHTRSANDNVWM